MQTHKNFYIFTFLMDAQNETNFKHRPFYIFWLLWPRTIGEDCCLLLTVHEFIGLFLLICLAWKSYERVPFCKWNRNGIELEIKKERLKLWNNETIENKDVLCRLTSSASYFWTCWLFILLKLLSFAWFSVDRCILIDSFVLWWPVLIVLERFNIDWFSDWL